jgi:very-short-patch-repair endonuclease
VIDPLVLQLGVLSAAQLLRLGWSRWEIERAVQQRPLSRLRPGWFAQAGADADVASAVRQGGCLACASALRARGVWMPEALERDHVRYARRSGKRGCAPFGGAFAVSAAVDDVVAAFRCLLRCGTAEDIVVVADSLLHLELATRTELVRWVESAPMRIRALLDKLDTAESGTETMVRLRLRALGLGVRTQVSVWPGMRVDLLIGQRLVVECDSEKHHSSWKQQQADRARDRELVARGYLVIRLTYRQIHDDWAAIERDVLAVVRRGDHRWPRIRKMVG